MKQNSDPHHYIQRPHLPSPSYIQLVSGRIDAVVAQHECIVHTKYCSNRASTSHHELTYHSVTEGLHIYRIKHISTFQLGLDAMESALGGRICSRLSHNMLPQLYVHLASSVHTHFLHFRAEHGSIGSYFISNSRIPLPYTLIQRKKASTGQERLRAGARAGAGAGAGAGAWEQAMNKKKRKEQAVSRTQGPSISN